MRLSLGRLIGRDLPDLLPDLHGFHNPSTVSLLLDTVVGWRQVELICARLCALTLWILGTGAHATYAGVEASSGSPLRAAENADVLFNYHEQYTHTTSLSHAGVITPTHTRRAPGPGCVSYCEEI